MKHSITLKYVFLLSWCILGLSNSHEQRDTMHSLFGYNGEPVKRTEVDVKQQDVRKHELFQQALNNQDTVLLLINKKAKSRTVTHYKRIPIYIPIDTSAKDYVLIPAKPTIKDTVTHLSGHPKNMSVPVLNTDSVKVSTKTPKKHSFFYRLFHKH